MKQESVIEGKMPQSIGDKAPEGVGKSHKNEEPKAHELSLIKRADTKLLSFGSSHPKVIKIIRITYQVISAIIVLYFGYILFKLINVAGAGSFFETAFAGLSLQTESLSFFNGATASVVLLLVCYGLLSLLLISKARILCDAAALYVLFFSLTIPLYQFPEIAAPTMVIYLIWVVHRFLLGTVVFRYQKLVNYKILNA